MNIPVMISVSLVALFSAIPACVGQYETITSLGLEVCLPPRTDSTCRKTLVDADYQIFNTVSTMETKGEFDFSVLKKAVAYKFLSEYVYSQGPPSSDIDWDHVYSMMTSCQIHKVDQKCIKSLTGTAQQMFHHILLVSFDSSDADFQRVMKVLVDYFKDEYLR